MSRHQAQTDRSGARRALALLLAGYLLSFVDRTILGIVQQPMKVELGLSDTQLGLLGGTAFALLYSTLGLPVARLAERGHRVGIVAAAVLTWSLATIACGVAVGFVSLFVARVLVGIGEAGGTPPSHALLAAFHAPARRARAIGIYSLGVPLGILAGALLGGYVAARFGWRAAFVAAGVPGLLLAPLVLTIQEPAAPPSTDTIPPLREALAALARVPALRHLTAGIVLASFAGYALVGFLPTLLMRRFGHDIAQAGLATGLITGIGGGLGTFLGGWLVARLQVREARWIGRIPALGLAAAAPLFAAAFLAPRAEVAVALAFVASIGQFLYLGPTYGTAQTLVAPTMRATTSAAILLLVNLIGLGLGPPLLGATSDALLPGRDGGAALALAMAGFAAVFLLAAWHYARAARTIVADLDRAAA
ncbi:MFS transporter [Sphingomonas sp. TX0522]|jgi:predicted MFS family arabinose efflux permease|uniref:MFS transporter n=1 Tax=Sphingomonas sp. TX0522 TaxID=2479205 RepID=UPI0018E027F2|nr:MFS transporter [Sphingomonas sp. TX0522]MBI0531991.1 MFS transporter [Sphingomonas sp. TX0522]